MKKELEQHVHYKMYCLIALFLIVVFASLKYENQRINNLEDYTGMNGISAVKSQPDPLAGWTEECAENKTVERYEFVDNNEKNANKCIYPCTHANCDDCDGATCCTYILNGTCFLNCYNYTKPYIKYWNETVCTKKILIKYLE